MKKGAAIKYIIITALVAGSSLGGNSQDIHFSQFYEAPLLRNPSLAGIFTGDIRVQAVYRDQWNNVANAYKTGSLNGEYKMPVGQADDFMTLGMQVLFDRAGTIGWTSTHLLPALNFHKSVSADKNRYLSVGFMGGMVQRYFDRSKMTTNSQYDNGGADGENLANTRYHYIDGSAGISYNATINDNPDHNFYLGLAFHHFHRPQQSFYRNANIELNPKWVLSGGLRLGVGDYAFMTMMADHSSQGTYQETVAGALYGLKLGPDPDKPDYIVHGGTFLRWNDALIPVIKVDYMPFSFSLSYDVNISKLKPSSYGRGGFELALSYTGFLDKANSSIQAVMCPRF